MRLPATESEWEEAGVRIKAGSYLVEITKVPTCEELGIYPTVIFPVKVIETFVGHEDRLVCFSPLAGWVKTYSKLKRTLEALDVPYYRVDEQENRDEQGKFIDFDEVACLGKQAIGIFRDGNEVTPVKLVSIIPLAEKPEELPF